MMRGVCAGGGFVANTAYGLVQLANEEFAPNRVTDAAAICLARRQKEDGRWDILDPRPPLGTGPIKFTALTIRALDAYMPPGLSESWKQRR